MDNDVTETTTTVAGQELRQFIERFERLDAEKKILRNYSTLTFCVCHICIQETGYSSHT